MNNTENDHRSQCAFRGFKGAKENEVQVGVVVRVRSFGQIFEFQIPGKVLRVEI